MRTVFSLLAVLFLVLTASFPAFAQRSDVPQYMRPYDQRGVNTFESPKVDTVGFDGFQVYWGAGFTQQFQALDHANDAAPSVVDGTNVNELADVGPGFNLATANLNLDAQLADGIRVNLITYLSSRHHSEAWVKGGYLQVDELPVFGSSTVDRVMDVVTVRAGHFEINYGDAHFRRTDNGNALHNPFVGNYIMEAFTTEIGGEVYARSNGLLAVAGVTGGEIKGDVSRPDDRAPSFYGKIGYDDALTEALRVRLTGSVYTTSRSIGNSLYFGDRAGSRYYSVMENTQSSISSQFTSGRINPVMRDAVTSYMVNPFVELRGLELFGTYERAVGRNHGETADRTWNQYAVEGVYRFLPREQIYLGARYNLVQGELIGSRTEVTVDRVQLGGGWFVLPTLLVKLEYVTQSYRDFPETDIRHGGTFDGFMLEGVIAF